MRHVRLLLWLTPALAVVPALPACGGSAADVRVPAPVVDDEVPEWELVCPVGTARKGGELSGADWWCEKPGGKMHGPSITHHPSGAIKERGNYVDGERDGRWTTYHLGGKVAARMYFAAGKQTGDWLSWYDNGSQWQRQHYDHGEREGEWIDWWDNGHKREQRTYRKGTKIGEARWWGRDGKLLRVEVYEDGKPVRTEKYVEGKKIVELH